MKYINLPELKNKNSMSVTAIYYKECAITLYSSAAKQKKQKMLGQNRINRGLLMHHHRRQNTEAFDLYRHTCHTQEFGDEALP